MAKDFIPRPNVKFNDFQKNIAAKVAAKAGAWGISGSDVSELSGRAGAYSNLFKAISNKAVRTMQDVDAHKQYRASHEKFLRQFINRLLRTNPLLAVGELTGMGIKERSKRRKQRSAIVGAPAVIADSVPGVFIRLFCRVENHEGKASKHPESDGAEVRYSVGSVPANFTEAKYSLISKRAHIRIPVAEEWRGSDIYIFVRWVNLVTPTHSGPWCERIKLRVY